MVKISTAKIKKELNRSLNVRNTTEKGKILEDLICYIFEKVPRVSENKRNVFSRSRSQELDIIFKNKGGQNGMYFFPGFFVVECKNWTKKVDGPVISWFKDKLKCRGLDGGVLIARCGITGNPTLRDGAYQMIDLALIEKIRIIIITGDELSTLSDTSQLIKLFEKKITELISQ